MSLAPSADEEQQRSDQIALHFYTKLFHVVYQARAFPGDLYQETKDRDRPPKAKVDRWFNLEIPDSDLFPRELREIYKSLSSILATANHLRPSPPLRIHVLLVVPESSNNQVLVSLSQSNTPQHKSTSRILIEPTPRYVLLETWKMQFAPSPDPAQLHPPADVALPTIYKHAIPLFRSLYSLLRILPTWKLFKKLRRRTNSAAQFAIQLRATESADGGLFTGNDERIGDGSTLGFDKSPTTGHPPLPTLTHVFPSIPHPLGSFTLSTTYLESPTFQLDDLESLLSSKFISLDEGGFVPTLSSATTATTSHVPAVIPTVTTTPGNKRQRIQTHPPESIADRFVIPSPSSPSSTVAGHGQGHFSHLRQPSLLHQHHRQRSDSYSSGNSPPSTTVPLPAPLSRLRLETNQPSSSSHRPPSSLLLLSSTATSHSPSPSPTSKSPFSPPLSSHPGNTPPQSTIPLPSLPSLHSLHSLPSLPSLPFLPPISPSPSPTTTQAMPIKRPNTINPFKTNTLLSASGTSTSHGAGSGQPGSAGSIHSIHSIYSHSGSIASLRHTNAASPLSREGRGGRDLSRSPPQHLQPLPFPTSGSGGKLGSPTSSPGPTFQKLSASVHGITGGTGTGPGAEIGLSIGIPGQRKRYSSSFTHRYASSVGSAGSGGSDSREGKGPEVIPISVPETNPGVMGASGGGGLSSSPLARGTVDDKSNSRSSSFLGKRSEDDDISLFMQDIETRKPLSGRWRMEAGGGASGEGTQQATHKRERTDGTDGTDRTARAEGGSSEASEGTLRDDRTVGGSNLGDEDGDEEGEGEGDGDGEELDSTKQRYSYPNQPSPLSPRSRLNPSRHYYANPGTTTQQQMTTTRGHPTPNTTETTSGFSSARPNTNVPSSTSPPGAIPTSQAEVEVRLKKMNEAFLKSLAGLGDGWSGQGSASGVASSSSTSAFQLRNRDGERLRRLMSQQGSEEVIGAIELSGSGGSGGSRREARDGRDGREDS